MAAVVVLSSFVLQGCASFATQHKTEPGLKIDTAEVMSEQSANADDVGWWYIGFHRNFEEGDTPAWYIDTLIASQVIKPVIDNFDDQITLWRFHRRAAADTNGHKFSLIIYCTRKDARLVYKSINENALVSELTRNNFIDRLSFTDLNSAARSKIEASSDKTWPHELQKAWPEFAMGVSKTWLQLIEQFVDQSNLDGSQDVADQVEHFRKISEQIDSLWEENGGHAFLHHLNALFGYQELYILERRRTRF